ncbi:Mechanosensitive ion channel protein [Actinidia chinensis var. chinensis]|uniref:Mechanosensitive ion channel protein n=1 Tax=Actinidia chinensis var. chinensis TaxID=1590841 RepID=A0A2R6RNG3_ACTCC|nr:Mechanosensitive ion channel protein [Actinidia chinensis var. chinensis]
MDFPSSLKKSFKSHGSYKQHTRKISAGGNDDIYHEEQPILSDHRSEMTSADENLGGRREVIVKIDGDDRDAAAGGNKIWRETSYEFWKNGDVGGGGEGGGRGESFYFETPRRGMAATEEEDPPSKLIGRFLNQQRAAGVEMPIDVDLEMEEFNRDHTRKSPPLAESPVNHDYRVSTSKDLKVSFQSPSNIVDIQPGRVEQRYEETSESDGEEDKKFGSQQFHNRHRTPSFSGPVDNSGGEVLRCTSFQRRQSILRTKTRSRLIDPPPPDPKSGRFGKSGQLRSGMLGRASGMLSKAIDDDEDDPLFDEDIPEEYKRANLNALTILQWVSLVLIVAALICSLSVAKLKGRKLRGLHWWKWEVLVLVLICGRLVSGWGIRIVVFFIERNFLLRQRVLYFVYGVRKPVQNCIWLGLVLIAWHYVFDERVEKETNNKFLRYVNKILVCFLVGTLLWLVKTLMVKVLASSFHVSTFFDRIQESLFNQYVIETLSGPPLIEIRTIREDEERTMAEVMKLQSAGATVPPELKATAFPMGKSGRVIGSGGLPKPPRTLSRKFSRVSSKKQDEGIPIDRLHKLNTGNVSAWNMKRLVRIVRHGVLSTLDEQILESTTGDESTTQIRSELEAKVAARKIFQNVAKRGSKFIYLDDIMRFMQEDEALKTMSLLEGSPESEKINKSALKNWVVNAFRERRALALTLNDTKTAVNKLHQMVNVVVSIIILVACLLILGIATSKFLLFISSQIVVVAFVFGNTCKTVFEAIIFLFVMHPFDVGDRCEIDGVQMIVEEMNILTTVFLRFDNQKICYPNSTLSTKPIGNYYRSPDMGDSLDFCVHIATPAEKIALTRQRIISYIESKKDHWYASPSVVLMNLEELNKIKMSVWMRHRMNHQDMGEKWNRRALVAEEMVKIFKDLDIEYRLLPIDINIRSMPQTNSTRMPPD